MFGLHSGSSKSDPDSSAFQTESSNVSSRGKMQLFVNTIHVSRRTRGFSMLRAATLKCLSILTLKDSCARCLTLCRPMDLPQMEIHARSKRYPFQVHEFTEGTPTEDRINRMVVFVDSFWPISCIKNA